MKQIVVLLLTLLSVDSIITKNLKNYFNFNLKNVNDLNCRSEPPSINYTIYSLSVDDGTAIGDVMPYFDFDLNQLFIIYLKDIWNDTINKRHPWYGLTTNNFYSYSQMSGGELLSCNSDVCSQDFSIGTGSISKKDEKYYLYYSGHNPNIDLSCVKRKEGIMLATSKNLNEKFEKYVKFDTMYAPVNKGFDEKDNFRDPFVFYDVLSKEYLLIIAARTSRGVIISYKSSDLYSWSYQGIVYDGDSDIFLMMETPNLFVINGTYYLLFSDINSKNVFYRKSKSISGPWEKPNESDRFDGNGFYAAKVVLDNSGDYYIFGWTNRYEGNNDNGTWKWGGNLIVHQLYQFNSTNDLAITIPHTIKSYLERFNQPMKIYSQWGFIQHLSNNTYSLSSLLNSQLTNIIFNPINLIRYKINTIVSFRRSMKDFGFMFGICDDSDQFYSLRFIPSQHRVSFDKINYFSLTPTTISTTDVPFKLIQNRDYYIQIVIENSLVVTYLDNQVALTARIYKAINNYWGIFAVNSDIIFKNILVTTS